MTEALPCIVCDQSLENVEFSDENQPYDGTAFQTYGHYGSTFFDEMDGSRIEINVCDKCLRRKQSTHIVTMPRRKTTNRALR